MGLNEDVEEEVHDLDLVLVFETEVGHFDAFVYLLRLRVQQRNH